MTVVVQFALSADSRLLLALYDDVEYLKSYQSEERYLPFPNGHYHEEKLRTFS